MPSLKYDVDKIHKEAKIIAKYTGLKLSENVISGRYAKARDVIKKLKKLSIQPNDTILFYYTGHGFRTDLKENPWPNFAFAKENISLDILMISNIINNTNARLKIVIADCCNNYVDFSMRPFKEKDYAAVHRLDDIKENYKKLFLHSKGSITIAAACPEQTSLAYYNGSLYTSAFISSLQEFVKKSNQFVDWQSVLDFASFKTEMTALESNCIQTPIYLLQVD
jgi:hypothetical protein